LQWIELGSSQAPDGSISVSKVPGEGLYGARQIAARGGRFLCGDQGLSGTDGVIAGVVVWGTSVISSFC
jgi:hypothetical protein